jgi:magnesium transporter
MIGQSLSGHPRAAEIQAALAYDHDTAGRAMVCRQLVATPADWTIEQVIEEIRARSADIERLYAVYVVDDEQRLIGYLKLRDLLLHPAGGRVRDIMRSDVTAVTATSDREDVLRIADQKSLPVVPVTDAAGHLVGLIGERELRAIGREEISEDLKALSSAAPDSEPNDRPVDILRRRFPWLASALLGALGAGLIVASFEEALEEAVILASLIPLAMDMAGNAGIQSSTVTIEAMASTSGWRGGLTRRFLRELGGSVLNGAAVGLLTAVGILLLSLVVPLEHSGWLAATAATTLILIIVQAAAVGVVVPFVLKWLNMDPAVGTGVFITTVNDFAGITVLFVVAKLLYLPHL